MADEALDMGRTVPDAKAIEEGPFPDEAGAQLEAAGFKCMGFKPAVRQSLPARRRTSPWASAPPRRGTRSSPSPPRTVV